MVKKYYKAKRLTTEKMDYVKDALRGLSSKEKVSAKKTWLGKKGGDWEFEMVGKNKAAAYARDLREINVSYSRRKVGPRTWRFKKR